MRGVLGVGLVLLSLVVAGCSGGSLGSTAVSSDPAPPPTVTAEKGSISGSVTDEELQPIAGADVGLSKGADRVTKTDASGKFTFNELDPGAYAVFVQKLGFESASKGVTVVAGEVADATFSLVGVEVIEPRHESVSKNGRIGCSYYTPVPLSGFWSYCPSQVMVWEHEPCLDFTVTEGNTWRLAEMVWTGTGATAPENLWLGEYNNERTNWAPGYGQGPSPLAIKSDFERKFKDGVSTPRWCAFIGSDTGANLAIDQAFTIYFTAFYHMEGIPEGFSALPK
ncbi:MAG: carboxypeptidase regulatory-like domain-containing protein [Euryarchaeota archaeon]|nr:carboxypeptidase regulatory-like domain-containing protein [Euryarchaeota archaeon]